MPQLNPAPWFFILALSWLVFLIVIPPKVLNHISPNDPLPTAKGTHTDPWTWPWH
uniref:ATP synthase complex subunit 8 n=1 Tax=Vinciguerria nimbaria TaxID=270541 RepID=A0A679EPV8_9TELE|nr:ATP synthase F0 subunit 8 [Vinciguerria nimbaria]BBG74374.1 ATPase subunits 8 [Vinciguerria nimbaria]BBU25583.1 ATPase subunit 8 [Vinciguerria nimbaria]